MKKCKKRLIALFTTILLLMGVIFPISAFAYSDFRETASGIPTVYSPMFGANTTAPVESSWNEPRESTTGGSDTPHRGVDQGVNSVSVGPMYSTAYIYIYILSRGFIHRFSWILSSDKICKWQYDILLSIYASERSLEV